MWVPDLFWQASVDDAWALQAPYFLGPGPHLAGFHY